MIRTIISFMLVATPAIADGQEDYRAALETADHAARVEQERLGRVDIGLGSDDVGRGEEVDFYSSGHKIENVSAELVAVHDDTANICMWGYQTDIMPSLPRTAALAVKEQADAHRWPAQAVDAWASTTEECSRRSNLATSLGNLDFIGSLAVGPYIVFFGMAPSADTS